MILLNQKTTRKLPTTGALVTPSMHADDTAHKEQGVMIIFEGPDNSGKSTIAKNYSELINIPYYKNPREREYKKSGEISLMSKYCMVWLADFIQQVPVSVILDRHYPSEWVYSQVEKREHNERLLREVDTLFAKRGAKIIICMKDSYEGYTDETTHASAIPQLVEMYKSFAEWTYTDTLILNTTNENLHEQLAKIDWFVRK